MSRWIANLPGNQVLYFAACEVVYRGLRGLTANLEPLGNHFGILAGYAFKSADYVSHGIRLLRNINVKPDCIDWSNSVSLPLDEAARFERFRLNTGDLVLSMDGTVNKQGIKIAFVDSNDVPSLLLQRVCRFEPLGRLSKKYLYHILHSTDFLDHLDESNRSIAIPHVSPDQLKSFLIPIIEEGMQNHVCDFLDAVRAGLPSEEWPHMPKSMAEQRRIVARIESIAAKIAEAGGLRQDAVEEAETLYPAALSAMMAPHGTSWKRETVGEIIVAMDAGWSPQCEDIPAKGREWGVLKTTSVQWCEFRSNENKTLPASLTPRPELCVQEGDVLVTRAGPRKRVGVVAAVRKTEDRLTISDKIIRLRPEKSKIESRFLELSLASPFSQEHLVHRKTGLADAQVNISQAILRETPVAYPSLPEQRIIVAYLDGLQAKVNTLKKLQAETAGELAALLPSILDKAFKGNL